MGEISVKKTYLTDNEFFVKGQNNAAHEPSKHKRFMSCLKKIKIHEFIIIQVPDHVLISKRLTKFILLNPKWRKHRPFEKWKWEKVILENYLVGVVAFTFTKKKKKLLFVLHAWQGREKKEIVLNENSWCGGQ